MKIETSAARMAIRDALAEAFSEVPIGETISHGSIAAIIGSVTTPDAIKYSAFREAEAQYGAAFENVRGLGYRRLAAADIHRVGTHVRSGIRSRARRGTRKITAVMSMNQNSMTNGDRLRAHTEIGILGMIQMAAGRGAVNRAYKAAEDADLKRQAPPSLGEIAAAVLGKLRATT